MLVGTLSSSVPHCPQPGNFVAGIGEGLDNIDIDRLSEFHAQRSGTVDKTWILFDSGACANC